MPNDRWIEITVVTVSEAVDAVSEILYDTGISGIAIYDPQDILNSGTKPGDWDYIDERLIPQNELEVYIKGYLPYSGEINNKIEFITNAVANLNKYGIDRGKGEVTTSEISEQDWANNWKQYYKPFRIGKHIVIKPTWERYNAELKDTVIEIDPGMAFGTGTHETTRMCIELLEEYINSGFTVFDMGCGSGILSIVSSKLGASSVIGVDIDEVAVRVAKENVRVSSSKNIDIKHGNLFDEVKDRADVIVANIIADVIIDISKIVPKFLKADGKFICSGIIKDRAKDVENELQNRGFKILNFKETGEWVAIVATIE